ncbi:MAG: tRNA uracil 4-sulfurtransferase ThiI [Spirochaetales bacterium]
MQVLYLIKPGELTLKGKNRKYFEDRLKANITKKLIGIPFSFQNRSGRMYLEVEETHQGRVWECLKTTPGIAGYALTKKVQKDPKALVELALAFGEEAKKKGKGNQFKVDARREDKTFTFTSYEIACLLGAELRKQFPELQVNLKNPDWTLFVEIRDFAYGYIEGEAGLRGLPIGTSGKGMLLLSGGIDSPVAGYLMALRGMHIEAVYFHSYPYTGNEALEKVEALAQQLARITGSCILYIVPFTDIQVAVRETGKADEATLMNRAAMMYIASILAKHRRAHCLITGESLGQVASQTIESIHFTNSFALVPVMRPLIGMDKEWIMDKAREIGTYNISILPYEDCCTLFSPMHPLTRPRPWILMQHWKDLGLEELLKKVVEKVERKSFSYPFPDKSLPTSPEA